MKNKGKILKNPPHYLTMLVRASRGLTLAGSPPLPADTVRLKRVDPGRAGQWQAPAGRTSHYEGFPIRILNSGGPHCQSSLLLAMGEYSYSYE